MEPSAAMDALRESKEIQQRPFSSDMNSRQSFLPEKAFASVLTLGLYPAPSRTRAVRHSRLPDSQAANNCRITSLCFDPANA
jgi:hypothetical protein